MKSPGRMIPVRMIGRSRHIGWLYLFLGGFLAGILLMNMGKATLLNETGLLDPASLNRMKYLEVDENALLGYVLKERLGSLLLLAILATTCVGIGVIYLYVIWLGALTGMFLSAAAIRYGVKGILLMAAGTLPQYLLLVPAVILLLNWCCQLCSRLYFPHRISIPENGSQGQYLVGKLLQLAVIIGVVIIGCILESYVNPFIVSSILKLF